jgi:hypothetical protein
VAPAQRGSDVHIMLALRLDSHQVRVADEILDDTDVVGELNEISGTFASVSGGARNTASGSHSSVSRGENNTASSDFSSVGGGSNRTAPGTDDWAAGPLFAGN